MRRKPTVLFLNNYPMTAALEGWRAGGYPGHHLWGANGLERYGFEVIVPPFSGLPRLGPFVQRRAPSWWGDCDQQLRAWLRNDYDVVYAGCQYTTGMLARLRNAGLFRRPVVALLHHELGQDADGRAFVAGHTRLLCLGRRVQSILVGPMGVPEACAPVLDWGPELEFYPAPTGADEVPPSVMSVGKTFRDHDTLVAAAAALDVDVRIVGTPPSKPVPPAGRISVVPVEERSPQMPYREVVEACARARVLAIPLAATNGLAGLTSLLDALALARPVIMTRNAFVNIDVEAEGIGLWVEPGDVEGWRRAIRELAFDAPRCREMGGRARALAERRYNIRNFNAQLAEALSGAIADRAPIGDR
jgi:glycosyltransferase involved in cell wall biosynthesis